MIPAEIDPNRTHALIPILQSRYCQRKICFDDVEAFSYSLGMKNPNPFRYFKTSPEIIRLAVMMYVRLRQITSKFAPGSSQRIRTKINLFNPDNKKPITH